SSRLLLEHEVDKNLGLGLRAGHPDIEAEPRSEIAQREGLHTFLGDIERWGTFSAPMQPVWRDLGLDLQTDALAGQFQRANEPAGLACPTRFVWFRAKALGVRGALFEDSGERRSHCR